MANYLPSLDERRKKLIEDCCGGMGGGDMQGATGDIEPPTAESEGDTLLSRTLKKIKDKKKTRRTSGT